MTGCSEVSNNPHPLGSEKTNTMYVPFFGRSPKYLDPTSSYSNDETPFTYQMYEPLYGYHYLKRPYELVGRAAEAVARPVYLDKDGKVLPDDVPGDQVAETQFTIKLRPGIKFAPHPAFAKDARGEYVYHAMKREDVADKHKITDFKETGTRELTADDYVYSIRRLATPRVKSPSFSTMADYIVGLKEYGEVIVEADKALRRGIGADGPRPAVPRFSAISLFRRRSPRQAHAAPSREGQVPAVQVLAGDDLSRPHSLGGREVLRAARHGGKEPYAQLLAGRHRPVHADRVRREPTARA